MVEAVSILRMKSGAGSLAQNALSVLLGTGFTFCLLMGVAHYARVIPSSPPPEIDDFRSVTLPIQPPPPPRVVPVEPVSTILNTTVTDFAPAPSDSPVKIAVTLPSLDSLLPTTQIAPPALIQIGQGYGEFRPRTDLSFEPQQIFQISEVDRVPTVIYRRDPVVPPWIRKRALSLGVTLLFVVDANGAAGNVRVVKTSGNPEFDALIIENVKEWEFSPAIKKNKRVKCLVQQPVVVKWSSGSPFRAEL